MSEAAARSRRWHSVVGLDGNNANIAMLQTPDGNGRLELFEYIHPDAIETEPTVPNEIGMHRVAFSVDDIDEALPIADRSTDGEPPVVRERQVHYIRTHERFPWQGAGA